MKRSLLFTIPFFYCLGSHAQQDPQYTQFMYNKQQYNPATIGFNDNTCFSVLARKQYSGYQDQTHEIQDQTGNSINLFGDQGAETLTFAFGTPIHFKRRMNPKYVGGIGVSMYSDKVGYVSTNYYKSGFSLRRDYKDFRLGIGANIGVMQKVIDLAGLKYKDPSDPKIPNLVNTSNLNANLGAGIWINIPKLKDLSIGYAVQNLSGRAFTFANINALAPGWHQYINIDAVFGNQITLRPYVLIKASQQKTLFLSNGTGDKLGFANPDITMGVLSGLSRRVEAGLGFRSSSKTFESINAILGFYLSPTLRLGYAYDVNTTAINRNHNNTHEITFNYCLGKQLQYGDDPRHLGRELRTKLRWTKSKF